MEELLLKWESERFHIITLLNMAKVKFVPAVGRPTMDFRERVVF